jgi:glutaredoxin
MNVVNLIFPSYLHFPDQILFFVWEADGAEVQDHLLQITGQKTVPNIFIGAKHIGGNDKVQSLNNAGELAKMLKK